MSEMTTMALIPYVDQDECIGCSFCEETCSEVFQLNEDGISEVCDPEGASEDKIQIVLTTVQLGAFTGKNSSFLNESL